MAGRERYSQLKASPAKAQYAKKTRRQLWLAAYTNWKKALGIESIGKAGEMAPSAGIGGNALQYVQRHRKRRHVESANQRQRFMAQCQPGENQWPEKA